MFRELKWQQSNRITISAYDERRAFEPQRKSFFVAARTVARLSEVDAVRYDCCVNSCVAYTGVYQELMACPECLESRYQGSSMRTRKSFEYIGIENRVRSLVGNPELRRQLDQGGGDRAAVRGADFCQGTGFRRLNSSAREGDLTIYASASLDGYLLFKQ